MPPTVQDRQHLFGVMEEILDVPVQPAQQEQEVETPELVLPQERVSRCIGEKAVGVPVPQSAEVSQPTSIQERLVDHMVAVLVPQVVEEVVEAKKARPQESIQERIVPY